MGFAGAHCGHEQGFFDLWPSALCAPIANRRAALFRVRGKARQCCGLAPIKCAELRHESHERCCSCGADAGYDGAKKRKGRKVHLAVDTLGHLLALHVTPANEQDRAQVGKLCEELQAATDESVEIAFVDQGYTGEAAAEAAAEHGIQLEVVKLSEAKRGFVLLPRRWVVERSFGWTGRFRRLARDYERLADTLKGMHYIAFAILFVKRLVVLLN